MNVFKLREMRLGFCSLLLKVKRKLFLGLRRAGPTGAQARAGLAASTLTPTPGPAAGMKLLDAAN